ncbi:MAG: hypothetical protein IJ630_06595 [Treponema sp.]|nr:hypothetical protein [Treponema sp.]
MNKALASLPIFPYLNQICENLKASASHFLVLTAETAAGKSTAVPLSILEHFEGKILMLEVRRLATTAISDRLSALLGEKTGETVGYRLHLESKISKKTRLEVITEAILIRKLQADPLLEDVNVIILDEFHERSVHSDLALAFLKETMSLRNDLFVLVMSATIDSKKISEYLGTKEKPAPVMRIPGRQFPVEIEYRANLSVTEAVEEVLEEASLPDSAARCAGSILVFLPGIYEIRKTKSELETALQGKGIEILTLHSSVPLSEQRKILTPQKDGSTCRVILSSAIAETSLTVPDVTVVIDSGLCRKNKMNVALGMERLVTEKESLFSAEQRSGRAGRVRAGRCIRLWDKNDVRIEQNEPEILHCDLTPLVLECAQWGVDESSKLDWLTPPTENAWKAAKALLEKLDCLDGKITEKGKNVLRLGLHPRLACVALFGGAEAVLPFSEFADASLERQKLFVEDLKRRMDFAIPVTKGSQDIYSAFLAGFPDRLSRLSAETEKNSDKAEYMLPSGRKALLSREILFSKASLSDFPKWIVAVEVRAGEQIGKIYSFAPLSDETVEFFLQKHAKTEIKSEITGFSKGSDFKNLTIQKKEILSYGEIVLKEKKLPVQNEDFAPAICDLVLKKGLDSLPLDEKTIEFLLRAEFYGCEKIKNLSENARDWLLPFVNSQKISSETIYDALYWYLDGNEIDSKVPIQLTLQNGKKRRVKYEKKADGQIVPSIEIIIQQIFGCFETPKILGKRVLLKLLSPALRPLQITDDLENFWTGAWTEICKEMKGRYPKHNWDYKKS